MACSHRLTFLAASLLVLCMTAPALAQYPDGKGAPEFALSIGYANVSLGSSSAISDEGALRSEGSLAFSPLEKLPQLRLGAAVGVPLVLDNSTHFISSGSGGLIIAGSSDVPLWLIEPELRLSWRQTFGPGNALFIEPGVAGGFAFGYIDLHDVNNPDISYHANSSTGYGRVFLRAGSLVSGGIAGIEASYLSGGNLDFGGNASGDLR